jgi:hypothetical protein
MSGIDRMNSSTQVPIVMCTWVPMIMSYHARHLMPLFSVGPAAVALSGTGKPPERDYRGPGYIPSWVTRRIYNGQIGGKIVLIRDYHDGRGDQFESFLDLILFKFVTHPLQIKVVRPYLIRGA